MSRKQIPMNRDIVAHGAYYEEDEKGFLINPTALPKPSSDWFDLMCDISEKLKVLFGTSLHSIYLRGSVAASYAEKDLSDLDMFVVLFSDQEMYWEPIPESEVWEKNCREQFPFFHSLDLYKTAYSNNFKSDYPALASIIKTQSVCVYGADVSLEIAPYKQSNMKGIHLKWLRKDLDVFYKNDVDLNACSAMMKIVLRAAFDLVMEKDGRYTNSLYFCWRSFSEYYPEKEKDFQQALDWYLNPIAVKELLLSYLQRNGEWLYTEACRLQMIDTGE